MTLTKDHIINSLSNQLDLPKRKSAALFQSMLETIKETLESGEDVLISGFGKFLVKEKNERRGKNPATGNNLILNASNFELIPLYVTRFLVPLIISIYIHRLMSGFLANTFHFGTDNITKMMISALV